MEVFMKYVIIFILCGIIVCFPVCGNEQEDVVPASSLSIVLVDSIAFMGISYESFFRHSGFGLTCTMFFLEDILAVEPGVFTRYYFGDISSSLYILGSATLLIAGIGYGASGILYNLNTGFGFNAIFGAKNNIRFSIELGPRLSGSVSYGDHIFFPHFQLMFGTVKNK
jgi:hypothetical protein